MTASITEFIAARIAEDEAAAQEAIEERRRVSRNGEEPDYTLMAWPDLGTPAVLVGGERVLREVAAKRAILEAHSPTWRTVEWNHDQDGAGNGNVCNTCGNHDIDAYQNWTPAPGQAWLPEGVKPPYVVWPCPTIRALAAVWCDHPEFNPEWSTT